MKINIECGKRLKECRMAVGLSQKEFAELVNYSVQQICYIENGKRALSAEAATVFAEKLGGIRPEYLLCKDNFLYNRNVSEEKTLRDETNNTASDIFYCIGYKLLEIDESEDEASGKIDKYTGKPLRLRKASVLQTPEEKFYYMENDTLSELIDDVLDYLQMRLEKKYIPKCSEATGKQLEAAGLTTEGKPIPKKLIIHAPHLFDLQRKSQINLSPRTNDTSKKSADDLFKEMVDEIINNEQNKKDDE